MSNSTPTSPDEVFAQRVGSFRARGLLGGSRRALRSRLIAWVWALTAESLATLSCSPPTAAEGAVHASGAGPRLLALAEWGHGSGAGARAVEPRSRWSDGRRRGRQ